MLLGSIGSLHREVVNPDEPDPPGHQPLRHVDAEVSEGGLERHAPPEPTRVRRLDEQPLHAVWNGRRDELFWADLGPRAAKVRHPRGTDEDGRIELFDGRASLEEVARWIHVRTGVTAERELAHVRCVAPGDALGGIEPD